MPRPTHCGTSRDGRFGVFSLCGRQVTSRRYGRWLFLLSDDGLNLRDKSDLRGGLRSEFPGRCAVYCLRPGLEVTKDAVVLQLPSAESAGRRAGQQASCGAGRSRWQTAADAARLSINLFASSCGFTFQSGPAINPGGSRRRQSYHAPASPWNGRLALKSLPYRKLPLNGSAGLRSPNFETICGMRLFGLNRYANSCSADWPQLCDGRK